MSDNDVVRRNRISELRSSSFLSDVMQGMLCSEVPATQGDLFKQYLLIEVYELIETPSQELQTSYLATPAPRPPSFVFSTARTIYRSFCNGASVVEKVLIPDFARALSSDLIAQTASPVSDDAAAAALLICGILLINNSNNSLFSRTLAAESVLSALVLAATAAPPLPREYALYALGNAVEEVPNCTLDRRIDFPRGTSVGRPVLVSDVFAVALAGLRDFSAGQHNLGRGALFLARKVCAICADAAATLCPAAYATLSLCTDAKTTAEVFGVLGAAARHVGVARQLAASEEVVCALVGAVDGAVGGAALLALGTMVETLGVQNRGADNWQMCHHLLEGGLLSVLVHATLLSDQQTAGIAMWASSVLTHVPGIEQYLTEQILTDSDHLVASKSTDMRHRQHLHLRLLQAAPPSVLIAHLTQPAAFATAASLFASQERWDDFLQPIEDHALRSQLSEAWRGSQGHARGTEADYEAAVRYYECDADGELSY